MKARQEGTFCPLIRKDCVEHKCAWYRSFRGINRNTGEQVDAWDCAVKWLPHLMQEQAFAAHGVGAAVESFRNEVVQRSDDAALGILRARVEPRAIANTTQLNLVQAIEATE